MNAYIKCMFRKQNTKQTYEERLALIKNYQVEKPFIKSHLEA